MARLPTDLAVPAHVDGVSEALVRARGDALVDLYAGWRELTIARASAAAERARELERVEARAQVVLNSVQAARSLGAPSAEAPAGGEALVAGADPLAAFVATATRELEEAKAALARRAEEEERFFAEAIAGTRERVRAHADLLLVQHRPRVEAQVQPVGKDRSLVHLGRLEPQDVVLLGYVLSGRLLTRYDAFFDDAVDEVGQEPARFYAEEGNERTRFERPEDEEALIDEPGRLFLPAKGMLPFAVPGRAFPRFRLVNRGPVIEAEARSEGGAYEHLMPRASAELLSGYLIRLQLEGRLELALKVA